MNGAAIAKLLRIKPINTIDIEYEYKLLQICKDSNAKNTNALLFFGTYQLYKTMFEIELSTLRFGEYQYVVSNLRRILDNMNGYLVYADILNLSTLFNLVQEDYIATIASASAILSKDDVYRFKKGEDKVKWYLDWTYCNMENFNDLKSTINNVIVSNSHILENDAYDKSIADPIELCRLLRPDFDKILFQHGAEYALQSKPIYQGQDIYEEDEEIEYEDKDTDYEEFKEEFKEEL